VYLAGPAGLFDSDFRGHGDLSAGERDTSVMLIDSQSMSSIPSWATELFAEAACRRVLVVGTSGTLSVPGIETLHADPRSLDLGSNDVTATIADAVYCGDLESVPDENVPQVLKTLLSKAPKLFCAQWTDRPHRGASRNVARRDERWWHHALSVATREHPQVSWQFQLRSGRRSNDRDGTSVLRRGGPRPDGTPPRIWVLTDDKAGHTTQSFGLADALGWPWERKELHFNKKARRSPRSLGASLESLDRALSTPLAPPWPDLVIATGRRAAPVARWIGRQSQGLTRLVQLGRKGGNVAEEFDLTVTCTHFRQPRHPDREEILAPITAVTPGRLEEARRRWAGLFEDGPHPWVALLVGGRSASHDIDPATARRMAAEVAAAVSAAGGSLYIATSPRTGREATAALRDTLGNAAVVYEWTRGDPGNPYFGCLAIGDVLIVTGDSESMIAEAVAAKKPTYIFDTPMRRDHAFKPRNVIRSWVQSHVTLGAGANSSAARKPGVLERWCTRMIERGFVQPLRDLHAMHAGLYAAGFARPFDEPITTGWQRHWTETDRVAARVAALLGLAAASTQTPATMTGTDA